MPIKLEFSLTGRTIEEQANAQGPLSLYLFSRLKDSEIQRQLLDILEEASQGEFTREQLNKKLLNDIEDVEKDTPISFGETGEPGFGPNSNWREILPLGYVERKTGKIPPASTWSIIEAHEKGHVVRQGLSASNYSDEGRLVPVLSERFNKAFDYSNISFSEEDYERFRRRNSEDVSITDEEIRKGWIDYCLSTPMEIIERMSQLKNYFGFVGHEQFTKKHLDYARAHYLQDTNHDNRMTEFFQAITPDKEEEFLKLINSTGG